MQDNRFRSDNAKGIPCPSDDLLGEIQATLSALADLECSHEINQERLKQGLHTDVAWQHLRVERERQHQQEREPYLHRLNQLEHSVRLLTSYL